MAHFLHWQHFNNKVEMETPLKNWYQLGNKELADRWIQTV